jgi:hypothetical protein
MEHLIDPEAELQGILLIKHQLYKIKECNLTGII